MIARSPVMKYHGSLGISLGITFVISNMMKSVVLCDNKHLNSNLVRISLVGDDGKSFIKYWWQEKYQKTSKQYIKRTNLINFKIISCKQSNICAFKVMSVINIKLFQIRF